MTVKVAVFDAFGLAPACIKKKIPWRPSLFRVWNRMDGLGFDPGYRLTTRTEMPGLAAHES